MLRLVIFACILVLTIGDDTADNDVMSVPVDVLKFIIGCKQVQPGAQLGVPVHHTKIDDIKGTTSQQVSILSMDELRSALKYSVHSDAVLDHIIGQVEEAARADEMGLGRSDCVVENNINISVPADEIDNFNDRVQMLMQQNSFKMLEQINTLFAYKLRNQKTETEKMIKRRTNSILAKLDKIMKHLGIPDDDGTGDDNDDNDSTDGGELTTQFPSEVVTWPLSESEPTTDAPAPVSNPEPVPDAGTPPGSESPTVAETSPTAETTSPPNNAEQGTEMPEIDARPTELFPGAGSSSSSEEDDDNGSDPVDRTASGNSASVNNNNPDFVRVSQQSPEYIASQVSTIKDSAQKDSQQKTPENTMFFRPISRPRPIAARPLVERPTGPVYPGISLEERIKQAAQRRRIINRPYYGA